MSSTHSSAVVEEWQDFSISVYKATNSSFHQKWNHPLCKICCDSRHIPGQRQYKFMGDFQLS